MNFRYPIFLDLTGKKCLAVGEGHEIVSKIRGLMDAQALVTYVNERAEDAILKLAEAGSITWLRRRFTPEDLTGCFLVISDLEDNSEVFRLAEQNNVLCNSVDDPDHCRFSFGSIHRSGDLAVAISTNGWAPALAVRLRQRFENEIGPEYGEFLSLLSAVRGIISTQIPDFGRRRELWYELIDSDALRLLRSGDRAGAEKLVSELIQSKISSISGSDISGDTGRP